MHLPNMVFRQQYNNMTIVKGMFLHKKDNMRFSKNNRYPVVKVYETHIAEEYPDFVMINSALRIKPEWVEEITESEFNRIISEIDIKNPKPTRPRKPGKGLGTIQPLKGSLPEKKEGETVLVDKQKSKLNSLPYKPGDFIRKKNWTFFNGAALPALCIKSIRNAPEAGTYYINKYLLYEEHLVKLTAEEAKVINDEYKALSLSEVLLHNSQETTCLRESTGNNKKVWVEKEVLRYVFTYNKVNPGKMMNAYRCPHCNEIHAGKMPSGKALRNDKYKSRKREKDVVVPFKDWMWPNTWFWVAVAVVAFCVAVYVNVHIGN